MKDLPWALLIVAPYGMAKEVISTNHLAKTPWLLLNGLVQIIRSRWPLPMGRAASVRFMNAVRFRRTMLHGWGPECLAFDCGLRIPCRRELRSMATAIPPRRN